MKVIGITGGVGCGKSAVLHEIEKVYNCKILLADDAAKRLEKRGQSCYFKLLELLGNDILREDLEIDPIKMSGKIFKDVKLLEKVNAIIHPAVKEYILDEIDKARKSKIYDYFFLEAALLIEGGYKEITDEMWYIFSDADVRKRRLRESRNYSDEKIENIMKNQLSEEEYRNNCDFTVDNSNTLAESMEQIGKRLEFRR